MSTKWLLVFSEVEHLKEEDDHYINENNTNNNSNFSSNSKVQIIKNRYD
jgi:hypothetical protein